MDGWLWMIIEAGGSYFWGSGRYLKFPKSKLLPKNKTLFFYFPKNTFTSAWVFLLEDGKFFILIYVYMNIWTDPIWKLWASYQIGNI